MMGSNKNIPMPHPETRDAAKNMDQCWPDISPYNADVETMETKLKVFFSIWNHHKNLS